MDRYRAALPIDAQDTQPLDMDELPTRKVRRVVAPMLPPREPLPASPASRQRSLAPRWSAISTITALVLLVLANLLIQLDRRAWDIRSDGYWSLQRVQQCEALGRAPDVLFLGSSRVVYGVNAHLLDSLVQQQTGERSLSCNAGMFGSTFEQDYYTFKRFLEDGYVPKVLVEDLREYNLNMNASETADNSGLAFAGTLPLADISDLSTLSMHYGSGAHRILASADFVAVKLIPMYGDRIGLYKAGCNGSHIGPCGADLPNAGALAIARYQQSDQHGWVALTGVSIATLTPAQVKVRAVELRQFEGGEVQRFAIGGRQPDFLARMIALAKAYGVKVALVVSPLHQSFFTLFDRSTDWPAILSYWNTFAQAHDVAFFDESRPAGFTDADWYDAEHLNAAGADKRAYLLAESVVEPMLAGFV
ncbi:MAG TPA: hypothetical protein VKQ30_26100 [Ktedonobacterales bacterium]|nr:hypothetical protein [Ktedonobacterales bacterium]